MKSLFRRSIRLGFLLLVVSVPSARAEVLGFEDLVNEPALTSNQSFSEANGGSSIYGGVTWDSRLKVVGSGYSVSGPGNGPLYSGGAPGGGSYYLTNSSDAPLYGQGIVLTTNKVLTSVYLGSIEYYGYYPGEGASTVTINALSGSTVLASVLCTLPPNLQTGGPTNTAVGMQLFNTSSFSSLTGITGYRFDNTPNPNVSPNTEFTNWAADNFTFQPAAVPEPDNFVLGGLALLLVIALRFGRRGSRRCP